MARKGDYLYKREGSDNWWIKLQYPKGMETPAYRKSLGTSDRKKAEILAAPMIHEHKQALYLYNLGTRILREAPQQLSEQEFHEALFRKIFSAGGSIKYGYKPNITTNNPDGTRTFATETAVFHLDDNGKMLKQEPNEKVFSIPYSLFADREARDLKASESATTRLTKKDADERIFETWVKHEDVKPAIEREAREVFRVFKSLTNGKSFAASNRDDGRALADYYFSMGNKSGTVEKKVGHLRAAVNLAIKDGKLRFNPFSDVVARKEDAEKRLPLSPQDMRNAREHLCELNADDQLLWKLLASTGMRLSEPFQIAEEFDEEGIRFVIVGTKTDSSRRRVPLPDGLLPLLPTKITGPILTGREPAASKRLNRFIRSIGITDKRKVLHGLRHRAKDKLRAAGCPQDIQEQILGHEEKTVAKGYGTGYPIAVLKPWLEKIGW